MKDAVRGLKAFSNKLVVDTEEIRALVATINKLSAQEVSTQASKLITSLRVHIQSSQNVDRRDALNKELDAIELTFTSAEQTQRQLAEISKRLQGDAPIHEDDEQ